MNSKTEAAILIALLMCCVMESVLCSRQYGRMARYYNRASLRKRAKPFHYSLHKCCLETKEQFCCQQVNENSVDGEGYDVEDLDPADFLRIGPINRIYEPEPEVWELGYDIETPRNTHWKSKAARYF